MPFLIRIIVQRVVVAGFGFLTFLGIAPEIKILDSEQIVAVEENRQEKIADILTDSRNETLKIDGDLIENFLNPPRKIAEKDLTPEELYQPVMVAPAPPPSRQITVEQRPSSKITTSAPEIKIAETTFDKAVDFVSQTGSQVASENAALRAEDVLFNIICTERNGNYVVANTGSAVMISPSGVLITNAHVAQFFLLEKVSDNYSCALYRENIPTFGYRAELLYIPPAWINNNKKIIISDNPRGTGEKDYAFLYITGNTNPTLTKPSFFSYVPINTSDKLNIGDAITVAGYPGAPSNITNLSRAVGLKTDTSQHIRDVFTFGRNQIDVISSGITDVAAKGASGGAIFHDNELVAVIVTTSGNQNNAYINGITLNYINRDLQNNFGVGIQNLISDNLTFKVQNFWTNYGESLAQVIIDVLN